MRTLDGAVVTALAASSQSLRHFIWLTAKDRDTGDPETYGFWTDVGNVTAQVVDGLTGSIVERIFIGMGALSSVGSIPLTADLSVRTVEVTLSQVDETVAEAVRGYDVRNAPIQIYRGHLIPGATTMVAPATALFVGFVDQAPVVTPAEGGTGGITLKCVSRIIELTRTNPDVRSHESQQLRQPGDAFYLYTVVVGSWKLPWGQAQGKIL